MLPPPSVLAELRNQQAQEHALQELAQVQKEAEAAKAKATTQAK